MKDDGLKTGSSHSHQYQLSCSGVVKNCGERVSVIY